MLTDQLKRFSPKLGGGTGTVQEIKSKEKIDNLDEDQQFYLAKENNFSVAQVPVSSGDWSEWGSSLVLLSGNAFNSANSKSCSLQHMDQISQLFERAGAVGGKHGWTIWITDTACLLPAPTALWRAVWNSRAIAGISAQHGARDRFIQGNFTAFSCSISWLFSRSTLLCCKSITCLWSWWQDIPWRQCS